MEQEADWDRVEELFHAALDLAPAEREAFLARECGQDESLRAELDDLLRADDEAETFLGEVDRARAAAPLLAEELPRRLGAYRLLEVVGEGGMGVVYRAERADGAFEQRVAVKMLRPGPATSGLLARFDAERRTLARLQHPDIARLFDAGEDERGAPWLAMEFVAGEPIDAWCDRRRSNLRERVELLARVCDAVAHAHDQLVVHRDLKPQNVLVDDDGRPRLLDFGIAKVLENEDDPGGLTETGERALTPAYAAPEQLRGEAVGVRTDVFALGVLAYELLSGQRPHGRRTTSRGELEREILERAAEAPSAAFGRSDEAGAIAAARSSDPRTLRRQLAGDLDRICLTALRKEPERRYGSAAELADELRRWLRGLPVRARGDGLGYRASKLVRRRPVETTLAVLLALVGVGAATTFVKASLRDREQLGEIQRLGDLEYLAELRERADELWPVGPALVGPLESWLSEARALYSRRDLHARTLERWRASSPDELEAGGVLGWNSWRADQLEDLVRELDELNAQGPFGRNIAAISSRLARSRTLVERSIAAERPAWDAALARLAADPRFAELTLEPIAGLVPLGPDPDGGLEAFWPVETGARPARDESGHLVPSAEGGLVLLLLPGGEVTVGAQADDPDAPRYDPQLQVDEGPLQQVRLEPFLLSKFEVTQGQWLRWTGTNPSDYLEGSMAGGRGFGPTNPVERVSWTQARAALTGLALDLPTEAQWDYANRAGSDTVWATGDDEHSLGGFVNIADLYAKTNSGEARWPFSEWLDDGHSVHAPVGSYRPNPFGLHDMLGNVWEWCRDRFFRYDEAAARPGDGLRGADVEVPTDHPIVARGGGYGNSPMNLRSAERYPTSPTLESRSTGIRPARAWR
ncbi:bifunctional serine/threonine-protein kinase/formylglycine-generating enzyme family protein [Engelhardtia mirabilis]